MAKEEHLGMTSFSFYVSKCDMSVSVIVIV